MNTEEMHRISCTCVSLRRRAPKTRRNGRAKQDAPKDQYQSPPISCPGEGRPRGAPFGLGRPPGSPDPLVGQIRPIFLLQIPTAPLHLFPDVHSTTSRVLPRIHPWRGYIRRRRAPPLKTHHHHVELVLHCKGEALPRLVLRVAGG